MRCPDCGYVNIAGVDQCGQCGAPMAGLDSPEARAHGPARHLYDITLADLDPAQPVALPRDSTVLDAVEQMRRHRHGAVYIVDEGKLVGIFTECDVLKKFGVEESDLSAIRLGDVMTPNPHSLKATATLGQALNSMAVGGCRHLPVVDDQSMLLGFVSVRGVLYYLHEHVLT